MVVVFLLATFSLLLPASAGAQSPMGDRVLVVPFENRDIDPRVGWLSGPFSAKPTKAATAVPTASIGREPEDTSSMYTPGAR